ncbi:hypothetical protein PLICRDRAFT_337911 [Plicaturopsis crispa FD-325 SS-3]|uniref:Uncharacterized protein n=1 Tax=Plicaturopsis crispa FD-325 SS-3 TaxID=944288 RepID=A0A0C9SLC9_PLICR|nr:hypothetical protein PLICRDRAFT_337911 [Plicaturopsis crispa FD-325 SS-3]
MLLLWFMTYTNIYQSLRATSAAFLPTVPSAGPDLQASHSHTGRLPPTAFNQRPQHGQANAHVPSSNAPVRITGVPVGRSSLESQPGPPGSTAFSGQSGWSGTGSQPSRPHLVQSNRSAASSPLPRSADLPASMANGKMSGDTKSSSLAMQQPQQPQTQRSAPPSRPIVVQRGSQEHGDGWANPNNARTQPGRPDARTSPSSSKRR